jgi:hypothetical protein
MRASRAAQRRPFSDSASGFKNIIVLYFARRRAKNLAQNVSGKLTGIASSRAALLVSVSLNVQNPGRSLNL